MEEAGQEKNRSSARSYVDIVYPIAITVSRTSFQSSGATPVKISYRRFKSPGTDRGKLLRNKGQVRGFFLRVQFGTKRGNLLIRYKWQIRRSMYARNTYTEGPGEGWKFIGQPPTILGFRARRADVL